MDRTKRVRILKRIIVGTVTFFILVPIVLCIILLSKVSDLQKQTDELNQEVSKYEQEVEGLRSELIASKEHVVKIVDPPEIEAVPDTAEESAEDGVRPRKVYLTFDDGPSGHTQDILDVLDAYSVKGNFFVCATKNSDYEQYYQKILDGGHMLGLHSYSHVYNEIYASDEAFHNDVNAIRDFVSEHTNGFSAHYYRFPGGSSNTSSRISLQACKDWLTEQGLAYYDWNISSQDATNPMQDADSIFRNATYGSDEFEEVVILMHDLGNKDSTVEALPRIIEYYLDNGSEICAIDENSMLIQHNNK